MGRTRKALIAYTGESRLGRPRHPRPTEFPRFTYRPRYPL